MESKGIRILDKEENHVSVEIDDIFDEINGDNFNWSIIFYDGWANFEQGDFYDFDFRACPKTLILL